MSCILVKVTKTNDNTEQVERVERFFSFRLSAFSSRSSAECISYEIPLTKEK